MHSTHLTTLAIIVLGLATVRPHAQATNCGLQLGTAVAFCETFDQPSPINSRAGQLNSVIWGVSRAIGMGGNNMGQGTNNEWPSTLLQKCDGTVPRVVPPNDVIICNSQLREASNDNVSGQFDAGDVTVLAMYPKQPFDFAGRTGTVSFDVSNDTHGNHAAWPEFWITDLPSPAPFTHLGSWVSNPQHAVGIRLEANAAAGQFGLCPSFPNTVRWTVGSAVVVRNYVMEDTAIGSNPSGLTVTPLECIVQPTEAGLLNHVEVRVSQGQIDVYATDPGVTTPLKHIAVITGATLSFTRGLIWLEDVHYNADKGQGTSQREHTFAWDNVAFDGPFTYRDLSYDALDNTAPGENGSVNLGKLATPAAPAQWAVLNLPPAPTAQAVRVLFNVLHYTPPTSLVVTVNGHPHPTAWPYPDQQTFTWRTLAVSIPIADLVAGTNTVLLGGTDQAVITANVNIVLVNAGSTPPVVGVTIAPKTVGLTTGASQPFNCSVTGSSTTACTWAVTEGASGGTVTSAGVYTAPATAGTRHVKATSVADPTKSDTATVTVTAPICPAAYPHGQAVALVTNGTTAFSTLCTP